MRALKSILGAFIGLVLPVLLFSYYTAPGWLYFAHIPITSGLFAILVLKDYRDAFEPVFKKYVEEGRIKKAFNPFYGWLIMSVVINIIFSIIHIAER